MKQYKRTCPQCKKDLIYKWKSDFYSSRKKNTLCKSCTLSNQRQTEEYRNSVSGSNNPFYGKNHTEETKEKLRNRKIIYTDEQKQQAREQLAKVNNTKHPFEIWKEKYSPEEYNLKVSNYKQKQSAAVSGSGNPMFGKDAPIGSGVGWSGWYKSIYFRSFRELSFLLDNPTCETAERKKYTASFMFEGNHRTCRADFILENCIIEIKPIRLQSSAINIVKREALIKLAKELNMEYKVIDPLYPSKEVVKNLIINGEIKFIKRFEDRIYRWAGCCASDL